MVRLDYRPTRSRNARSGTGSEVPRRTLQWKMSDLMSWRNFLLFEHSNSLAEASLRQSNLSPDVRR